MEKATLLVDRNFVIAQVDRRIYGTFVEPIKNIIYGNLYNPEHPSADEQGFRKDVMELLKELKTTFIRYPGGNFVSGYHWKNGIGPKEKRPSRLELAWNQIETNQMGIDEYYDFCQKVGVDSMLAVNLGTGTSEEAAQEVEYCNYPGGTELSELRKKYGHAQPHKIKMWCLGNEMDGPWQIYMHTAEEYGRIALETAKMMKWVDPSIELVICGSCSNEVGMVTYGDWDRIVLEHTYEHVDFISLHRYYCYDSKIDTMFNNPDEIEDVAHFPRDLSDFIDTVMAAARFVKGKRRSSKDIRVCFDEWGVVHSNDVSPKDEKWEPALDGKNVHSAFDAAIFGAILITFINKCDLVKLACQSIVIHSMIAADPDKGAFRQPTFFPFRDAATYGQGVALRGILNSPVVTTRGYGEEPAVHSAVVYNEEKGEITVFAVNLSLKEAVELEVDFHEFGAVEMIEHIQVYEEQPLACNTFEYPDRVGPKYPQFTSSQRSTILPRLSWNVLRYRCARPRQSASKT